MAGWGGPVCGGAEWAIGSLNETHPSSNASASGCGSPAASAAVKALR